MEFRLQRDRLLGAHRRGVAGAQAVIVVNDALADRHPSKPHPIQRHGSRAGGWIGVVSAVAPGSQWRKETVPFPGSFSGGGQQVRVGAVLSGGNHFRHPDENDQGRAFLRLLLSYA